MLVLSDAAGIAALRDPYLRELLAARAAQVLENAGDDYALEELVTFVVVEPGDAPDAVGRVLGFSPLEEPWGGPRYGDPAFGPSWELLEDLGAWYELVFVVSDDGFGYEVFVPKAPGVDPELLAMCAQYAVPAPEGPP